MFEETGLEKEKAMEHRITYFGIKAGYVLVGYYFLSAILKLVL